MGYAADPARLHGAVTAYRLAADLADDKGHMGRALLRTGWVYRALDDWPASTAAWELCATRAPGTRSAADALWLAAENLAWTGQPEVAAARLRRMAVEYPEDARMPAVADRIEDLEAQAQRSETWLVDPVPSLQAEIDTRSNRLTPGEVYSSAMRWLRRRGERAAMIGISRWACLQHDWPVEDQVDCRHDLVDALLLGGDEDARSEAVEWLREIVDLAPSEGGAVTAALRRYHLLNDMGRSAEADQFLDEIGERARGSRRWEPVIITTRIESLLGEGDLRRAREALNTLVKLHPDYDVRERFPTLFPSDDKEGLR
jgi:tetratricopeptide (TPR) repeat protein